MLEKVEDNSTVVNLLTNAEKRRKSPLKFNMVLLAFMVLSLVTTRKETLKISQFNSSGDISQGDKVVTGGLVIFNATDISVGEVVSVTHSNDYLTREVLVKLQADSMNPKVVELVGESIMRLLKQIGMFYSCP